jgi:hypothetical protein
VTDADDGFATSDLMAQRYGRRPARRRWPAVAAGGILVVALLGWLAWSAWVQGTRSISAQVVSFDVVSEHRIDVTVTVSLPSGRAAQCTIQAQAEDHTVVGEEVVAVAAGTSPDTPIDARIRTDREATSASIADCH